jgi:hypothetical protein
MGDKGIIDAVIHDCKERYGKGKDCKERYGKGKDCKESTIEEH